MNIFEITIQRKYQDSWFVVTEYTKTGELPIRRQGTLKLNSLDNFAELGELLLQPRKYGEMLGKGLFYEDVRDAFVEALANFEGSQDNNDCLHVLLQIEAEDLRELRWEKLCAPKNWNFLTLNQRTPFSFYIPAIVERRFPPIGRRDLRALVIVASPEGLDQFQLAHFDVGETVSSVKQALGEIPCDVLANVDGAVGLPTPDELMKHLTQREKYYTLLHIVCHGKLGSDGETALYLAEADNRVKPLDGSTLIERLNNLRHAPHFAFLSTCESASAEAEIAMGGLAQRLVRELGMPAVVAMTEKVSIKTAQALATTFYQQLRNHGNVDLALVEATAGLQGRYDITVPALFSRLGGRPLFSDIGREQLTNEEIKYGLEKLQQLLPERSPVLSEELQKHIKTIHDTLGGESGTALKECKEALDEVDCISLEVSDLSFKALALGKEPTPYDARCPFRGLYPFRLEDHEFFCGREELIEKLQQKLSESKFLPVLGASGSGKSSVVMAGLIPALQKQEPGLVMAYMTPKEEPLAQLEASLLKVQDQPYVLVVDQFEELFTLCNDKSKRQDFIKKLLALTENQRVILTMRADFWGECAVYPKLKQLMQTSQELIAPMNSAELRKAIDEQAKKVGLRFEVDLLNIILGHLKEEAGAMPLLQHALLELWKLRHGRWLLPQEYHNTGGVQKAIAKTADDFYGSLEESDKKQVKNIFIRLTHLQKNGPNTKQQINQEQLMPTNGDQEVTKRLVKDLADKRLVITSFNETTNKEVVEVAHEALIEHWDTLKKWLNEERESLLSHQFIAEAAEQWKNNSENESYLVHQGGRLEDAEALIETVKDPEKQHSFSFNEKEVNYIKACRQYRNRQEQEKADSLSRSSSIVFDNHQELDALHLAIQAGKILQIEKIDDETTKFSVINVLKKIVYKIKEYNRLEGHENWVISASFSPDGNIIATGSQDKTVILWSSNGKKLESLKGHKGEVFSVAFSPDGKYIATASADKTVKLWNLVGQEIQTLTEQEDKVGCVIFSPNGKIIATANDSGIVTLWNFDGHRITQQPLQELEVVSRNDVNYSSWYTRSICFSPDGQFLVTASRDSFIKFWKFDDNQEQLNTKIKDYSHLQDKQALLQLEPFLKEKAYDGNGDGWIDSVCFSPNGEYLVAASKDKTAKLWKFDGKRIHLHRELKGHHDWLKSVCFSSDGEIIATASHDRTIKLWNLDGQELQTLIGHKSWVNIVAFKPKSKILATASDDTSVKLWKISEQQLQSIQGHQDSVWNISFHPDGNIFATASNDKTVKLWEIKIHENIHENKQSFSVELLQTLQGHSEAVSDVCFSRDGKIIVTASHDKSIKLWRFDGKTTQEAPLQTLENKHGGHWITKVCFSPNGEILASTGNDRKVKLWKFHGQTLQEQEFRTLNHEKIEIVMGFCFSPNTKIIATACRNRTAKLWNLDNNQPILNQPILSLQHDDWVRRVCFSPNGKIIATASDDRTAKLWKCDGSLQRVIKGHNDELQDISFSPDGKIIATASNDRTVKLWNLDGEELHTVTGYKDPVKCVSFVPIIGSNTIVTGTGVTGNTAGGGLVSIKRLPSLDRWINQLSDANLDKLMDEACGWIKDYEDAKKNVPDKAPSERELSP